jgi:hypothetical protein
MPRVTCERLDARAVPAFLPPVSTPGEGTTFADVTGDGRADVLVLRGEADGRLTRTATLTPPRVSAYDGPRTRLQPQSVGQVLVGDLTGAVTGLPGVGDGTFQPARTLAGGAELVGMALTDFDGDGRVDLVRRERDGVGHRTAGLLNDGAW